MFKTGLTLGKFMPPHKGHEYMIDFAANMCENLIVIVGGQETDVIPVSLRLHWLEDHYTNKSNIRFIIDYQDVPVTTTDEHGTCTDPKFWDIWREKLKAIEPNIDAIFTSDRYGQRTADEIGAVWVPVDPKRELFQISATRIRENPMEYFSYLINEARSHFTKTVAIVGPESCGKTMLAKELAYVFDTVYVPEYGRILSEIKNNDLSENDFKLIADAQETLTKILLEKANQVLIQDTEMLTTYLFGKIYLNMDLTYLKDRAKGQTFDLYILLAPTVEWINDGTRVVSSDEKRWVFYNELKALLDELNKPYVVIDDKNYADRTVIAIGEIHKLLKI